MPRLESSLRVLPLSPCGQWLTVRPAGEQCGHLCPSTGLCSQRLGQLRLEAVLQEAEGGLLAPAGSQACSLASEAAGTPPAKPGALTSAFPQGRQGSILTESRTQKEVGIWHSQLLCCSQPLPGLTQPHSPPAGPTSPLKGHQPTPGKGSPEIPELCQLPLLPCC